MNRLQRDYSPMAELAVSRDQSRTSRSATSVGTTLTQDEWGGCCTTLPISHGANPMKTRPGKDICNLTSSGLTGQYVLWRGQLASTGFGTESIGYPTFNVPESSRSRFRTVILDTHRPESGGTSKATTDGQVTHFGGESAEGS